MEEGGWKTQGKKHLFLLKYFAIVINIMVEKLKNQTI